jgi:hypothetical protein
VVRKEPAKAQWTAIHSERLTDSHWERRWAAVCLVRLTGAWRVRSTVPLWVQWSEQQMGLQKMSDLAPRKEPRSEPC